MSSGPLDGAGDGRDSDALNYTRSPPLRQSSWGESSPWGAPASLPRSGGSSSVVAGINESQVPPAYLARWHALEPSSGVITTAALRQVLGQGGVKGSVVDEIMAQTATSTRGVTAPAFFSALALLANAQLFRPIDLGAVAQAAREGTLAIPTLPAATSVVPEPPRTSYDPPAYIRSESMDGGINAWGTPSKPSSSSTRNGALSASPVNVGYLNGMDEDEANRSSAFGEDATRSGGMGYGDEGWALPKQDKIQVSMREELAGVVFKHTVWMVVNERGQTVERRFSDFCWLLDSLLKRYPFRMLPSLPPKRVHVGGTYVMTDDLFLDRRRRGLERFLTFLANHPTLKHDGLVKTFLNEQSDVAVWRKKSPISLEEEAYSRPLTSSEEMSIPSDLEDKLSSLRSRILPLVEHWTRITTTADRIAHRRQNQGADLNKMKLAFDSAIEVEASGWRVSEVEDIEREERALATALGQVGDERIESARRQLDSTVEELKRHRELYVSFRDLFGRHATLSSDGVDKMRRRVETNLKKLENISNSASSSTSANADFDKLSSSIESDQRVIDALLRRRTFIRWSMWQEMLYLFRSTSLFKLAVRDYVRAEKAFTERIGGHWERLETALGD